jgi:hypothetical protein
MLLYSSFAVLVNHRWAFYFLFLVWGSVFVSRIYLKEQSLIKKDGYQKYKDNSYLLCFKFFRSDLLNLIFYSTCILVGYYLYINGGIEQTIKKIGL